MYIANVYRENPVIFTDCRERWGGGGQKMSVFVHAQVIKTVHAGGEGGQERQNSVHVVVEWPLKQWL